MIIHSRLVGVGWVGTEGVGWVPRGVGWVPRVPRVPRAGGQGRYRGQRGQRGYRAKVTACPPGGGGGTRRRMPGPTAAGAPGKAIWSLGGVWEESAPRQGQRDGRKGWGGGWARRGRHWRQTSEKPNAKQGAWLSRRVVSPYTSIYVHILYVRSIMRGRRTAAAP